MEDGKLPQIMEQKNRIKCSKNICGKIKQIELI